ncbi:MAG TPA: serine/threonine-protein kinase [Nannocystaceae bacterium]|nr:serine/threonine-protein kinase [Nannocystaceae bacterium]
MTGSASTVDSLLARVAATEPWDACERVPERLGRHRVLRRLGRGGLGVVYLGIDETLGREVALKVVRPDRGGAKATARLRREAQALARVVHPAVVSVLDVGEHAGAVYIVMERLRGITARRWVAAQHDWRAIVRMYARAGRGLAAAHRFGIVHRDVKPDNIMVEPDGRVVVVDFGLAAAERGDTPAESMDADDDAATDTGAVVGTRGYIAPECLNGATATAASDQYALCVAIAEHLHGAPERVRAILRRGHDPDPRQRFAQLDALLDQLERATVRVQPKLLWAAGVAAIAGTAVWAGSDASPPAPAAIADAIASDDERTGPTQARIDRVRALRRQLHAGHYDDVAAQLPALLDELRAADDARALAHAMMAASEVAIEQGDPYPERALTEAFALATATHEDDLAFETTLLLASGEAAAGNTASADAWLGRARALVPRTHTATAEGRLLNFTADALEKRGDHEGSLATALRASELFAELGEPGQLSLADSLGEAANAAWSLGRIEQSRELRERALAEAEAALGPDHPHIAYSLAMLAATYKRLGNLELAVQQHRRALEIDVRAYGPGNREVSLSEITYGLALRELGRHEEGRAYIETAAARLRPSADDHLAFLLDNTLSEMYAEDGELALALPLAESALVIAERRYEARDPSIADAQLVIARIWLARAAETERPTDARRELERADSYARRAHVGLAEATEVAPDEIAQAAVYRARIELGLSRWRDAAAHASEALPALIEAQDTATAQLVLAAARWHGGDDDVPSQAGRTAWQELTRSGLARDLSRWARLTR